MSWLVGPGSSQPAIRRATEARYDHLALTPDGETLIGVGWSHGSGSVLDFLDPATFEVRASLRPAFPYFFSLGVTNGHLVVKTVEGLAVYPWRELLGGRR
jgi:hypothetical protein